MLHKNICICVVLLISVETYAQSLPTQDTLWITSISSGLNFNQASFSDNWIGGGVNSIALASLLNAQADYKNGLWSWDNDLELLYGVIKNSGQDYRKSQDRILLDSKVGYQISSYWNGYFSTNFLTQFAPGYRYEELPTGGEDAITISDFLAPAFLTFSLGFEYVPTDYFKLRLSPFAPRLTFVTDNAILNNVENRYGVPVGANIRYEWFALQIMAELNKNLTENIKLQSRYMFFANYEEFSPERFDQRLDLNITAKLTNFINVSFSTIMIYDYDQIDELQMSQLFGLGILLQKEGALVK